MLIIIIFRIVFILCLSVFFIKYFRYPSYMKFKQKDTVFSENQVEYDPEKPLMITIFAWRGWWGNGWKENQGGIWLREFCNTTTDFASIMTCIHEKTYLHTDDLIARYTKGQDATDLTDITNDTIWVEGITNIAAGKFYSIKTIYAGEDDNGLHIHLKTGQKFSVYIHDPNFYVLSINPDTVPNINFGIEDSRSQIIYIKAVYHQKMNKPNSPCVLSKSYNFTRCVADFVTRRVGCRLEFDSLSSEDIPACTKAEQLEEIEKEYVKIWNLKQSTLVKHTGCSPPCSYVEYKQASENTKYVFGDKKLSLKFSRATVLERREQILYPLVSFISEFGGALGLFLGFSLMTLWDAAEVMIKYCTQKILSLCN